MEYIILTALTGFIYSAAAIFVYRLGFNDGLEVKEEKKLKNPFIKNANKKTVEFSVEEQRINTLIENIDNYNGSGQGQKEVI